MNIEQGFNEIYNEELELALYKKTIDLDYSKISHKFGVTSRLSPNKLENYNQNHLYNKLYRNEKQRKSIQAKVQTINPVTVKNFIDNNGKFINYSTNKVYDTIKGKHYILLLGKMPFSSRSKTPTTKTQSYQYTQTSFYQGLRTQNKKLYYPSQTTNKTCEQIKNACYDQLKEKIQDFANLEFFSI